jgi:hypothetical protein
MPTKRKCGITVLKNTLNRTVEYLCFKLTHSNDYGRRRLRDPVYFWTKAWKDSDKGLYYDFESSPEHLEYQLIGMASELYPEELLNKEGT